MRNPTLMSAILATVTGGATVLLIAAAMIVVPSRQTMATPEIAKATGAACAKCHTAPPALNAYGKSYQTSHKAK